MKKACSDLMLKGLELAKKQQQAYKKLNKKGYKMNQYLVSCLITQRGDQVGWIEDVIQSGLREGEYLETITITKLEELDNELV